MAKKTPTDAPVVATPAVEVVDIQGDNSAVDPVDLDQEAASGGEDHGDLLLSTPEPTATPRPAIDPLVPLDLPESVTLAAPHGYIDDDGVNHHWHPGTVVTDEDEIALLIGRKAPLVGITHEE